MTWPIRVHVARPAHPAIGDMWPDPELLEGWYRQYLSPAYLADRMHRAPLVVRIPGNHEFCIDDRFRRDGDPAPDGWTVTGETTALTLSPSVNIAGIYHGHIQNGFITPDCEGRTF